MSSVNHVDDNTFEDEVLKATTPVLVEFGATWCGPCKRQLPVLEQLMTDVPELKVVLIDIDDSPTTSAKLGIRSVPTLILFKEGQKVKSLVGLSTLAALKALL
jgi:thioredoxin 1